MWEAIFHESRLVESILIIKDFQLIIVVAVGLEQGAGHPREGLKAGKSDRVSRVDDITAILTTLT